MPFLRLIVAHLNLTFSFLVVALQSFALLTRGRDHLSSRRGWLDLVILLFSVLAVTFNLRSALNTAHLIDTLKHEAEQTFRVSQEAQGNATDALCKSQSASDKAGIASNKADSAETHANAAEKLSEQAEEGAFSSLHLAQRAQGEIEAQHRALRSIHITLSLSGSMPLGYTNDNSISSYSDDNDVPMLYLYSVFNDAKDSENLQFAGHQSVWGHGDTWNISIKAELINKGSPTGEDIRMLNAYRSICVDMISDLGELGITLHNPRPVAFPTSFHIALEVNGAKMQQPALFSQLYVSAHQSNFGKPMYCVTLNNSLDDIYEKH